MNNFGCANQGAQIAGPGKPYMPREIRQNDEAYAKASLEAHYNQSQCAVAEQPPPPVSELTQRMLSIAHTSREAARSLDSSLFGAAYDCDPENVQPGSLSEFLYAILKFQEHTLETLNRLNARL